jgi:hypothetical protein
VRTNVLELHDTARCSALAELMVHKLEKRTSRHAQPLPEVDLS